MSEWDEYAAGWDDDAAVRAYAGGAWSSVAALIGDTGGPLPRAAACDFGCGTGLLTERLVERYDRVDAVDTSAAMREVLAGKAARLGWRHVRLLDRLPAEPQGYDLIACSSVLAFVDDHPATVARLAAHLAPGGWLVHWDWEADPDAPEEGGLAEPDIRRALVDAGLDRTDVRIGFEVPVDGDVMRPLMGSGRRPG